MWLSNPHLRLMTPDQRGRFVDVYAFTHGTETPGVMTEDEVRAWAGYTKPEWRRVRATFAPLFDLKAKKGRWVLADVLEAYEAGVRMSETYARRARAGVDAKARRRKDLATTSATSGVTSGAPQVAPQEEPRVDTDVRRQTSDVRLPDFETTDQPDSDSRADARAQTSRSRAGTAGEAGTSRELVLPGIEARALGSNGNGAARTGSA